MRQTRFRPWTIRQCSLKTIDILCDTEYSGNRIQTYGVCDDALTPRRCRGSARYRSGAGAQREVAWLCAQLSPASAVGSSLGDRLRLGRLLSVLLGGDLGRGRSDRAERGTCRASVGG